MQVQILDKVRVPHGKGSYIGTVMEFGADNMRGLVKVGSQNIFGEFTSTWVDKELLKPIDDDDTHTGND